MICTFGNKEESVTNKYKLIVYVINDSEGGATGGGNLSGR